MKLARATERLTGVGAGATLAGKVHECRLARNLVIHRARLLGVGQRRFAWDGPRVRDADLLEFSKETKWGDAAQPMGMSPVLGIHQKENGPPRLPPCGPGQCNCARNGRSLARNTLASKAG
jgi:hypothetical protein